MLEVKIEDGEIVIRLPFDVLESATEMCSRLATYDDEKNDWRKVKVTNILEWAKEVARQLEKEEEDGSTPVTELLDKAFEAAVGDGAEGIWIEGVYEVENEPSKDE